MGLHLAGFDVVGVDIEPQPNYPFRFVQADALSFSLTGFDFVWASPPCQAYTPLNAYNKKTYPDLVATVRARLRALSVPYSIENVVQAPLENPVTLCGTMFGLSVYRHRNIETSFRLAQPIHPAHLELCARNGSMPTAARKFMTITGGKHSRAWRRTAAETMGVEWMQTTREVCEAIPPAYGEYVGRAAMLVIRERAA
jgi:DNA (cytosine-5)-methyltransferase 1